jgi:hypothetical protein
MGTINNDIKVKVDYDNGRDKNFIFNIGVDVDKVDSIEADINKTVNVALRQKIKEGEMDSQNLRGIEIQSDDKRGFFSSFVGDVEGLLKSL